MKKLFIPSLVAVLGIVSSCGGGTGEEIPVRYGSERDELLGNPVAVSETVTDFEGVRPGRPGKIISVDNSTYGNDGNLLTYEIEYSDPDRTDYRYSYTCNDKGRMLSYTYEDGEQDYSAEYTWKGDVIVKSQYQYMVDGEPANYYKYSYKGNKEVSRSLYSKLGVKLSQTDYTWDGEHVVKVVENDLDEGTVTTRTIERPDDHTEVITLDYGDDYFYTVTITFNDKGNYASIVSVDDGERSERIYTYEYDPTGNWTKRTVRDGDGSLLWTSERDIKYNT